MGAARFNNYSIIQNRVINNIYGIETVENFNEKIHPIEKRFKGKEGNFLCGGIFTPVINKGSVENGQFVKKSFPLVHGG